MRIKVNPPSEHRTVTLVVVAVGLGWGCAFRTEDTGDDRCSCSTQRLQELGLGSALGLAGNANPKPVRLYLTLGRGARTVGWGDLNRENYFFAAKNLR